MLFGLRAACRSQFQDQPAFIEFSETVCFFDVKADPPVDTTEIDEGLRPTFEPGKLVSSTSQFFIPATHLNDEQERYVMGFAFKSKNVWCLTCFTVQTSFGIIVHSGSGFNLEEREIELGKNFNIIICSGCASYLGTRVVLCRQWVLWKLILTTSKRNQFNQANCNSMFIHASLADFPAVFF